MIPVVTAEEMRAIDAAAGASPDVLIERAGAAVAREARRILGGAYGKRVVVVAGPGNNGADGRVAARRLSERGVATVVVDALDLPGRLPGADLVIDAAFGTGFRGGWSFPDVGAIPVLAVDVPTGLDADTGEAELGTPAAVATITFAAAKPGHYFADGPALCGRVTVADIGLAVDAPSACVLEDRDVAAWLPTRSRSSHKWLEAVRVVAGSQGMTGAAHLACAAAMRAGASLVTLSTPGVDGVHPVEVIARSVPAADWAAVVLSDLHRFRSLVVGPGLGRAEAILAATVQVVRDAVVPVVVDGDGLFALSWNEAGTPTFLADRGVATVLTPHDGEYQTLLGHAPGPDRIAAATSLVELSGATVLLKGPTTVVAAPGRVPALVTTGDARLATAGTGDVLSGIIGALLARGVAPFEAAAAAAHLHGLAAQCCPSVGTVAGDLVDVLPAVFAELAG